MSSSKIIKSVDSPVVTDQFYLEEFQEGAISEPLPVMEEGFQPLWGPIPVQNPPEEIEPPPPPPPPPEVDIDELLAGMISLEDAQHREQDAYDNGFAEGRRQFEEEYSRTCQIFGQVVSQITELREQMVKDCEEDLLRLTIMLAERILRKEITLDRRTLAHIVAEALENIDEQDELVIRFNPEDFQMISESRYLDLSGIKDTRKLAIKPDDTITSGGFIIDAPTGQLDGRIEAQLTEIFERLMEQRARAHDDLSDDNPSLFIEPDRV